ncbi:MAG: HEAT repeat domain-containing protein, partial [Deltaproteobacteria bacterium]|nr:HEAT repeat domain-containing protein [Deltaproteobacteria bacterium]
LAPIATVLGCLGYAAVVGRVRNDKLLVSLLLFAGIVLAAASVLVRLELVGILHAVFCAAYLTQAVLISLHFWTFAADFFDTLQSKRLYPYLVVGASLGGVLGGTLAAVGGTILSADYLILGWSITLLLSAAFVWRNRGDLRGWRTIGVEERDESSAAGMRGALRFLSRSPLAGWLAVSIVGMISALFLIQFLYMRIFSEAFDSAETLAVFLGVYLAVSNLIEIFTGTVITPWLLRRYGVRTANLVHPVLTLLVFPVLWLNPVLLTAIAARAVRELVENAVAAPIRQLSYNALPFRFRGRVRALLEGVVLFAAMATAGLALIVVGRSVDLLWLCTLGGGLALLYLSASFLVRREYLRSLVTELRRGRLDLQNLDAGLGQGTLTNLAEQWEDLLIAEPEYPSSSLLKLAGNLAERGFGEVVLRASQHPHPRVRTTCIEALANFDSARLATALPKLLDDQDSDVRLAAIRAAVQLPEHLAQIDSLLRACLDDPDPRIRAHASVACGAPGEAVLKELLASDEPGEIVAALESLPVRMSHAAENRLSANVPCSGESSIASRSTRACGGAFVPRALRRRCADRCRPTPRRHDGLGRTGARGSNQGSPDLFGRARRERAGNRPR